VKHLAAVLAIFLICSDDDGLTRITFQAQGPVWYAEEGLHFQDVTSKIYHIMKPMECVVIDWPVQPNVTGGPEPELTEVLDEHNP
jgi:hypothetical protein